MNPYIHREILLTGILSAKETYIQASWFYKHSDPIWRQLISLYYPEVTDNIYNRYKKIYNNKTLFKTLYRIKYIVDYSHIISTITNDPKFIYIQSENMIRDMIQTITIDEVSFHIIVDRQIYLYLCNDKDRDKVLSISNKLRCNNYTIIDDTFFNILGSEYAISIDETDIGTLLRLFSHESSK